MIRHDNDNVATIVEPSSGILRAAWARPLLTGALIDSYYWLLDEAENQGQRRYWQLDMSTRIWPAATFTQWLSELFAPQATQRLGGPVHVACWISDKHQARVAEACTKQMQADVAQVKFYIEFFTTEPSAREWLLHQQSLDGIRPSVGC